MLAWPDPLPQHASLQAFCSPSLIERPGMSCRPQYHENQGPLPEPPGFSRQPHPAGWANKVLLRLARYVRDEREHALGSNEILLTSSSVLTRTFRPDRCPHSRSSPPQRCLFGHSDRVNVRLGTMSPRTAGKGQNRSSSQAQAPQNDPSDAAQSSPQRPWPRHIRQILPYRGRQATANPSAPTCSEP